MSAHVVLLRFGAGRLACEVDSWSESCESPCSMTHQLTLTVALALVLGACGTTDSPTGDAGSSEDDGGPAVDAGSSEDDGGRAVDAGDGVCCAVGVEASCTGATDVPAGGWAASAAACTVTISGPFQEQVEVHGCTLLVRRTDFSECVPQDAGL